MGMGIAKGYTVEELHNLGPGSVPSEFVTSTHLVYNSPAALAFNSPGAEGFGVKRAGLAIPGSIMLIVSPGCCGRNTSDITRIKGYEDRFFYLEISETDLVTARHLKMIPQAVEEIIEVCREKPSLVMICITCVDALLGTDMERVARKAEERVHIPVRPCYMYALTREGRRPPMVAVRQSLYSLLPEQKRKASSVNLLGFFAPVDPQSELFDILRSVGVKNIRQISVCIDIDEFYRMGEANFNLVLNPEARDAADDLRKRLKIPSIELTRFYGTDRIARQYRALFGALGIRPSGKASEERQTRVDDGVNSFETIWNSAPVRYEAEESFRRLKEEYQGLIFSVGEVVNGNPFELALSLIEYGFAVKEIFANPAPEYAYYIRQLAERSPKTMVYSNMEPTMIYYDLDGDGERTGHEKIDDMRYVSTSEAADEKTVAEGRRPARIHVTLGKDAAYYHPDAVHVTWASDEQPWGYVGVRKLAEAIEAAVKAAITVLKASIDGKKEAGAEKTAALEKTAAPETSDRRTDP